MTATTSLATDMTATTSRSVPLVFLTGVGGFGASHLTNIQRLQSAGKVTLQALIDPTIKAKLGLEAAASTLEGIPLFDTITEAVQALGVPDIIVIAVPIHLHAQLAKEALLLGADVLLEKPPCSRLADFESLLEVEQQTGRVVQIGFQSLGSQAMEGFASDRFGVGKIRAVRASGLWLRRRSYWQRTPWAGKRTIGEIDVVDGVATNGLAHAVMTALRIANPQDTASIEKLDIESYRANAVDVDDTTSLRIRLDNGVTVTCALTLCAPEQSDPIVEVVGSRSTVNFHYVKDEVHLDATNPEGRLVEKYGRTDLLENLLAHRREGIPLLCPLASTRSFMRVLEAIRTGPQPVHIEKRWIDVRDTGLDPHPVVQDIAQWVHAAVKADSLFSEVGAPWAFTKRDTVIAHGDIQGQTVFDILDGAGTVPQSSPRPYIHPIRTLKGVEVSATRPADHDWHHGLGFAIPDVDGISFWGGGTFVLGQGYVTLDNHGTMVTEKIEEAEPRGNVRGFQHRIAWKNPIGHIVIRETRRLEWSTLYTDASDTSVSGWQLLFSTSLTALDHTVSIGSPGTNGRENAGYGGFFWRLPPCLNVNILSATAEGEDAVHGSVSPWIGWSGEFGARPGATGNATLIITPNDVSSAADPWVVRLTSYPGIGSAIAWKDRVEIPAGETITRSFRLGIVDGLLDRKEMEVVAGILGSRIQHR